jgi:metal-responsive CopG/Arc/MetJ family transcriptional regulator
MQGMKRKTSIPLSQDLMEAIDRESDQFRNRSGFIEAAIRAYVAATIRNRQDARDLCPS